jgi:hypothetical protein
MIWSRTIYVGAFWLNHLGEQNRKHSDAGKAAGEGKPRARRGRFAQALKLFGS